MKSVKQYFTVERLSKMNSKKSLDFDFVIQRKGNIWDNQRKSMLIHSILTDFPIPSLYVTKTRNKRVYSFIDGKQRVTSVLNFTEDGFTLDKSTAPIGQTNLAGKKFSELPEEMQKKINEHKFELYRIEEATMEELEDLFYRLNNGMPLKQIETTRAILGGKLLLYVEGIAKTPFFQNKIALSKASRLRFADQELVLQILSLIHNRDAGFSGREIQNFVKELRKVELQRELITKIENVCYYLNEAYPKKAKFLRKIHIPSLFIIALENQEKAQMVSHSNFREWSEAFFADIPPAYFQATQSGSAKKENVQTRIKVMKQHYQDFFLDAKDSDRTTKNADELLQVTSNGESLAYVMNAMENPDESLDTTEAISKPPRRGSVKSKGKVETASRSQQVKELENEKEGASSAS